MTVTLPVHAPVQGVSQQGNYHRTPGTLLEQINCYSSHIDMVRPRHPSIFLGRAHGLSAANEIAGEPYLFTVDRGPGERYLMVVCYKFILVYNAFTGERIPVLEQGSGTTVEQNFTYLGALKTSIDASGILDQKTPEDLSNNMGSTQESESASPPDVTKSWKTTATITAGAGSLAPEYTITSLGGATALPGPLYGKANIQTIKVLKDPGVTGGFCFWYYRFVQPDEGYNTVGPIDPPTNRFPRTGTWTRISAYVKQETSGTANIPHFELAIHNVTSNSWYRAKWTFTADVLNTTPTLTGNVVAEAEAMGNGWYRVKMAYRSTATEYSGNHQRRVGVYADVSDSQSDRRMIVHGFLLEEGLESAWGDRFWSPNEAYQGLAIQDYNLFLNRTQTTAMDSATAAAKSPTEEFYFWVKNAAYDAGYKISMKAGNAKCKVGAKVYMAASHLEPDDAANAAKGGQAVVGYTYLKRSTITDEDAECSGAGSLQDYKKGLYVGLAASPNTGMLRIPEPNTEQIALHLAFKQDNAYNYQSGNRLGDGAGGTTNANNGVGNHGLKYFLTVADALKPFDATTITWPNNASNTVEVSGSLIRVTSPTAVDEVEVWDSFGGEGLTWFRDTVQELSELPKSGPCKDGFKVRVKKNTDSQLDDYFVKFEAEQSGAFGPGRWVESVDYGVALRFQATTMPHQLIRKQDDASGTRTGTPYKIFFEWGPLKQPSGTAWNDRAAGDNTLNPQPSFIGRKIQAMDFAQGRLWFAAGNAIIGSQVDNYFNFWRKSARARATSDPVDTSLDSRHGYPISMLHAFKGGLLAFDKKAVNSIFGSAGSGISYETADRRLLFSMEHLAFALPVSLSDSVFVAEKRGAFSVIQEIMPSEEAQNARRQEATGQAPQYIDGAVVQMAASSQSQMLAITSGSRYLYCVKFSESGGQRIQQALWKYDFGSNAKVHGVGWIEDKLYLLIQREYGFSIETMTVSPRATDSGSTWLALMDRRCDENTPGFSKSYTVGPPAFTTITLPYRMGTGETAVIYNKSTGAPYTIASQTTLLVTGGFIITQLTVSNVDLTSVDLWVGIQVPVSFTFNPLHLLQDTGRGVAGRITERTSVFGGRIAFESTYTFTVSIASRGVTTGSSPFTAPSAYSNAPDAAAPYFESGVFPFGCEGEARDLAVTVSSTDARGFVISKAEFDLLAQ